MASNSISIEIKNIQKLKVFLSESLKLAEELENKLNQINQNQANDIANAFAEKIEEVVQNLASV